MTLIIINGAFSYLPLALALDILDLISIQNVYYFCLHFPSFDDWLNHYKITSLNPNILPEFCWHGNQKFFTSCCFYLMQIISSPS